MLPAILQCSLHFVDSLLLPSCRLVARKYTLAPTSPHSTERGPLSAFLSVHTRPLFAAHLLRSWTFPFNALQLHFSTAISVLGGRSSTGDALQHSLSLVTTLHIPPLSPFLSLFSPLALSLPLSPFSVSLSPPLPPPVPPLRHRTCRSIQHSHTH